MAIFLENRTPSPSDSNVAINQTISLTINDLSYPIDQSSTLIWVDNNLAYIGLTDTFQSGFSGTITPTGNGFDIAVTLVDDLPHESIIEVAVECSNSELEEFRETYLFTTILNLYYNIYYSTSITGIWKIANEAPLLHSVIQNTYTITGLEENVPYHVTIIAGNLDEGVFVPLMSQPVGSKSIGALDIFSIKDYPRYIIKTFAP